MKTRHEIAKRIDEAMADWRDANEDYNKTSFDDPKMPIICETLTALEAEIRTLRWVLGEVK